jgi:hypothetical protein
MVMMMMMMMMMPFFAEMLHMLLGQGAPSSFYLLYGSRCHVCYIENHKKTIQEYRMRMSKVVLAPFSTAAA